ncbi:MAG TPA: porin [Longimicrobium sp.]|nr:porin [Longimicrobium sp.]
MQPIPTRIFTVTSALLLALAAPAAGQGFVIATPDSAARITFGGRVQTIFNTTSVEDEPETQTELRRVRLEANLQLGRVVSGRIQPDFAGDRVTLKDVYVRFTLDPALQIWAGQAHRPFGAISPYSSARLLPMEKGVRIRGVDDAYDHYNLLAELGYSDRDLGLQLRGEPRGAPLGLTYAVGWFNGPARADAPEENSGQVVARLSAAPVRGVRIGASWSRRDFILVDDEVEEVEREDGNAWAADVEVGSDRGGLHLIGEVAYGDFDPFAEARFLGVQGMVGYRTGRLSSAIAAVEPLLRVSRGDPDYEGDNLGDAVGGTLYTPGVNIWLGGLNRLAVNYEIWNPREGDTARSFKTMFQLAF